MGERKTTKQSRVPTTRVGRLVRLGFTAGELAVGGLAEGVQRAAGKPAGRAAVTRGAREPSAYGSPAIETLQCRKKDIAADSRSSTVFFGVSGG